MGDAKKYIKENISNMKSGISIKNKRVRMIMTIAIGVINRISPSFFFFIPIIYRKYLDS
jgi:hypothetical protein